MTSNAGASELARLRIWYDQVPSAAEAFTQAAYHFCCTRENGRSSSYSGGSDFLANNRDEVLRNARNIYSLLSKITTYVRRTAPRAESSAQVQPKKAVQVKTGAQAKAHPKSQTIETGDTPLTKTSALHLALGCKPGYRLSKDISFEVALGSLQPVLQEELQQFLTEHFPHLPLLPLLPPLPAVPQPTTRASRSRHNLRSRHTPRGCLEEGELLEEGQEGQTRRYRFPDNTEHEAPNKPLREDQANIPSHVSVENADEDSDDSMVVIRKNNSRDAGAKHHCNVCSADITGTVRVSCAEVVCPDHDLCVSCFCKGEITKNHDLQHRFRVVEQPSLPIYSENWGADEELALLEGAEKYGLGSWADIAEHIGGYRTKDEVRDHYLQIYIEETSHFPLPERADPKDTRLLDETTQEEFQASKKRRIEERKQIAQSTPAAAPKQKPAASVPSCHEVQGFMPARLEFETEFANDAEEGVQHMQFEPGDGIDPATGELTPEADLKMVIFDIYNTKLQARQERKGVIFEHDLLSYKKNIAADKKRTKEERDLLNKAKPFAKMMNHEDFEEFTKDLLLEHNLRVAIAQLQEWRANGVTDLRDGEVYEAEKLSRAQRSQPQGQFDRLASVQRKSNQHQPDHQSEAHKFTAPELPLRFEKPRQGPPRFTDEVPAELNEFDKIFAETSTGAMSPPAANLRTRYVVQPMPGITPWKLEEESPPAPDLQLLSREEISLCNALHMRPKPYLVIKEALLREAMRNQGNLKKKDCRAICRIDVNKANRIYDFMMHSGWMGRG